MEKTEIEKDKEIRAAFSKIKKEMEKITKEMVTKKEFNKALTEIEKALNKRRK